MQDYNFHTHTFRCGHATGDEYDMAESAIANGFKVLGISEHIGYEGWETKTDRMSYDMMEGYFEAIEKLKEKYKGKLTIYTGLEFEYFVDQDDYYDYVKSRCDYMILGQHNNAKYGKDLCMDCNDQDVIDYANNVVNAIEKGYTRYIAHPSYFMLPRMDFSVECEKAIEKIATTAKKYGAALECNLKGMSRGKRDFNGYSSYVYPHLKSWEIIREIDPMIVIGYDVHIPSFFKERHYEEKIRKILKDAKFVQDYEIFLYR